MNYPDDLLVPYTLENAGASETTEKVRFSEHALEMMKTTPLPKRHLKLARAWEGMPLPEGAQASQARWLDLINGPLPDLWKSIALTGTRTSDPCRWAMDRETWNVFWRPTKTALPSDSFQEMLRNIGRAKLYDLSLTEPRPSVAKVLECLGEEALASDVARAYQAFNDFARAAPFLKEADLPTLEEIASALRETGASADASSQQFALF